ncbi:MAG: alkaline phosphatase family protein, partial [Clostridia bacterium]|nr:alkaline phosphatase family protein [Clostridia bacterium]
QNAMVEQALIANDEWLGRLMEATMDAGTYEDTNFAVISDHGHLPVRRILNPNIDLVSAGLIRLDSAGRVTSWDAFCNSASLSSQVVMKDPSDTAVRKKLEDVLYALRNDLDSGVESVFTKTECASEYHLTGDFEYVLESRNETAFGNACTGPRVITPDNSDYKFSVTSHGHLPSKGPQPVFILSGPDVRENVIIERASILDEAPTFAALMGFTMPQATGHILKSLLK